MTPKVLEVLDGLSLHLVPRLKPGSIQDWDQIVSAFNTKFLCAEAKYTLAQLGCTRKYPGKDLDLQIKRFDDKALDCSDPVNEEVLVGVASRHG